MTLTTITKELTPVPVPQLTYEQIQETLNQMPEFERGYYQGMIERLFWFAGLNHITEPIFLLDTSAPNNDHSYILTYISSTLTQPYRELLFDPAKFLSVWYDLDCEGNIWNYQLMEEISTYQELTGQWSHLVILMRSDEGFDDSISVPYNWNWPTGIDPDATQDTKD